MLTEALNTARQAGAPPSHILVRADAPFHSGKVIAAITRTARRPRATVWLNLWKAEFT